MSEPLSEVAESANEKSEKTIRRPRRKRPAEVVHLENRFVDRPLWDSVAQLQRETQALRELFKRQAEEIAKLSALQSNSVSTMPLKALDALTARIEPLEARIEALEGANALETLDEPPEAVSKVVREVMDEFDLKYDAAEAINEKLIEKYKDAKGAEELARSHGEEYMGHLKRAERLETAIKWNKGRLAETL